MTKKIDGNCYRRCMAWRFIAGNNTACFDFCIKEQRKACQQKQEEDQRKENNEQKVSE